MKVVEHLENLKVVMSISPSNFTSKDTLWYSPKKIKSTFEHHEEWKTKGNISEKLNKRWLLRLTSYRTCFKMIYFQVNTWSRIRKLPTVALIRAWSSYSFTANLRKSYGDLQHCCSSNAQPILLWASTTKVVHLLNWLNYIDKSLSLQVHSSHGAHPVLVLILWLWPNLRCISRVIVAIRRGSLCCIRFLQNTTHDLNNWITWKIYTTICDYM